MNVRYKILFTVELLHDYYQSGRTNDFDIVPDEQTKFTLDRYGMMYRMLGNKLVVLVRVGDDDKPMVSFDIAGSLRFYILQENVYLYNFTNLDYEPSLPERYYFTNRHKNKLETKLYLSAPIAEYDSAISYEIGDVAAEPSGEVYEAIRASDSGNAHALGQAAYWLSKGKKEYLSSEDLVEIGAPVYNFTTTPDTSFTVNIYTLNADTDVYDKPAVGTSIYTSGVAQPSVQLDLRSLPSGKYLVDVNGDQRYIYIDRDMISRNVFGLIEIFNHLVGTDDFALIAGDGSLKHPTFTIQFASRAVIWKFKARSGDVTALNDTAAAYTFSSLPGNLFISAKPIPLAEKPYTTLMLVSTAYGNISPVANPGRDRLNTITKDGEVYYCAEQYLNY